MLLTLIKNNVKLLIRSKIGFIFMCILPVVLTLILTSAFSSMGKRVEIDSFLVGYSLEEGSYIEQSFLPFKESFKENGIVLEQMTKEEGIKAIREEKIVSYIIIGDSQYTLYNQEGIDINAMIFESSFQGSMYLYDGLKTMIGYMAESGRGNIDEISAKIQSLSGEKEINVVKKERLNTDPVPNAADYYGIVEIIFIIWFGATSAIQLAEVERKNKVTNRMKLTNVKPITLFLGRLIPNVIATCVQVGIAIVASALLLNVNWGDKFLLSAGILLGEVIAISSFGTMLTMIIKSSAIPTLLTYISAFVFGFIGGSFQTYMYNFISAEIVRWSPLYYLNRTLVELSTNGSSRYLGTTLVMLLAITVVSFVIGLTYMHATYALYAVSTRREA